MTDLREALWLEEGSPTPPARMSPEAMVSQLQREATPGDVIVSFAPTEAQRSAATGAGFALDARPHTRRGT